MYYCVHFWWFCRFVDCICDTLFSISLLRASKPYSEPSETSKIELVAKSRELLSQITNSYTIANSSQDKIHHRLNLSSWWYPLLFFEGADERAGIQHNTNRLCTWEVAKNPRSVWSCCFSRSVGNIRFGRCCSVNFVNSMISSLLLKKENIFMMSIMSNS